MIWDIAAGVLLAGASLGLITFGVMLGLEFAKDGDSGAPGWIIALMGAGLGALILFMAHHH